MRRRLIRENSGNKRSSFINMQESGTQSESEWVDRIETRLFLEAIRERYGYDLSCYENESLLGALDKCKKSLKTRSLAILQDKLLRHPESLHTLIEELFPSPSQKEISSQKFFHCLKKQIVPTLKTYPKLRIWHLGCGEVETTGELIRALKEEKLLERSHIYATEMSEEGVKEARLFKEKAIKNAGKRKNISYFSYNFLSDTTFNEFHAILVSTPMGGLKKPARDGVLNLLDGSLTRLGFLGFFEKNSLRDSFLCQDYRAVGKSMGWYQRRR